MQLLGRCEGIELHLVEPGRAVLVDRGARYGVVVFVAALIAVIAAGNALFPLLAGNWIVALVLVVVGAVAAAIALAAHSANRSKRARPTTELPVLLVFNGTTGWIEAPDGRPLTPIAQARAARFMQLASSSAGLELTWPNGRMVIARGTPFGDSVDGLQAALRTVGVH